jgi:hypothetical protein
MLTTVLGILLYTALFVGADRYCTARFRLQGVYYFLHAIHNAWIVALTAPDVWNTFANFAAVGAVPPNMPALQLCFALHIYHCIVYWRKFRYDDWLHHALMIGIALPLGWALPSGRLLGFSLFFTTGLPGGIDYVLLFLTRNALLDRAVEKRVNTWLNVWIRAPGTAAHAALTVVHIQMAHAQFAALGSPGWIAAAYATAALNYWNGQYFMQQVVRDCARREAAGGGL